MNWPDTLSMVGFLLVVLGTAGLLLGGLWWVAPRLRRPAWFGAVSVGLVGYWVATAAYAGSGVAQVPESFVFMAPLLLLNLALAVGLGLSPVGRRLARLPGTVLIGFHLFRLPLEVVLHSWADQGVVPVAMSWGGQNLDVLTPVLALAMLPFVRRFRWLALLFSAVGFGFLINIFRIVAQHLPGSPLWTGTGDPILLGAYGS